MEPSSPKYLGFRRYEGGQIVGWSCFCRAKCNIVDSAECKAGGENGEILLAHEL